MSDDEITQVACRPRPGAALGHGNDSTLIKDRRVAAIGSAPGRLILVDH